ncbi:MAG: ABC transporter ATP-binding protein [Sandaracinaceae bacterium]|nr:ABC transporter ATP-binding protein [Sandaracinaceae bacterium]
MTVRSIVVEGLGRRFGDFVAVRDVSFHVEKGEIFGYLGANGAGKSTTIRMLSGLLEPTSGRALVAGHDIAKAPDKVKASIGYMSQKFSLYLDLTVRENLEFFGGIYGSWGRALSRRVDETLESIDMRSLAETSTAALPGGLRQRLALGSALFHKPPIVFLDEPTAGVDPASRREFWKLIRGISSAGTTVFVTTHYMDEAEYCARIGLMVAGKLVALDTPAALKSEWVPGRILRFEGEGLVRALSEIRRTHGVVEAQSFGNGVHVRFDPGHTTDQSVLAAVAALPAVKVRLTEPVEATLEDVFLAAADRKAEDAVRGGAS